MALLTSRQMGKIKQVQKEEQSRADGDGPCKTPRTQLCRYISCISRLQIKASRQAELGECASKYPASYTT